MPSCYDQYLIHSIKSLKGRSGRGLRSIPKNPVPSINLPISSPGPGKIWFFSGNREGNNPHILCWLNVRELVQLEIIRFRAVYLTVLFFHLNQMLSFRIVQLQNSKHQTKEHPQKVTVCEPLKYKT